MKKTSSEIKDMKVKEIFANRPPGEEVFCVTVVIKGTVSKDQLEKLIEAKASSFSVDYTYDEFNNLTIYSGESQDENL